MGEQVIGDAGDLVGRGHDGWFGPEPGARASVERPQAVLATTDRLRCRPKRVARAVTALPRAPALGLPPGDFVMGGEP
jgi:hypothetical protein